MTMLGLLLFVACLVAIGTSRIGLPYTTGLVVAGLGLGLSGYSGRISLTPDLVFTFLLPPLIFEAALHLGWKQARREAPLMKDQNAAQRLRFIMESESLVNDGAAAVLFSLALAATGAAGINAGAIGVSLLLVVAGGVACGLAVSAGLLLIAGRAEDHLVELTLTVLAAYGSFALAQALGVSGVLATLAAGMVVGNQGRGRTLTDRGGEAVIRFWDFAAFLANSIIFILIGSRAVGLSYGAYLWPALIGVVVALGGRAVAIYPVGALFALTPLAIDLPTRHLLFWGGLRGALALALALAVPRSLAEHDALVGVTFAVVAFSIFVQGLTVPVLLRRADALARA